MPLDAGVDFFDDSKIQNLINAYLNNPPLIVYENVAFPNLPSDRVVGLVTIRANPEITSLRKNIWKYWGGSIFLRDGSISMPKVAKIMRQLGLKSKVKKKYKTTTDSNHKFPVAANIIKRNFKPERINQTWVSDIT